MVEAVPMTMQVPPVKQSADSTSAISASVSRPARYEAQRRLQSVQAPRRSPRHIPVSMGPATTETAGISALTAAMIWAGSVLSHPESRTTASMGCARIISSVSIAARFLKSIVVGDVSISWSDMVGKASGSPPASSTPRFTAATISGIWRWQVL